jgi:3-oxoadipate enol-lactonase
MAADIKGERFAWREAGLHVDLDGSKRDVVILLHGLGGSRGSWEPQLYGLRDRFRVIAWDLPGYGASASIVDQSGDAVDLTFDLLADAVCDFANEVGVDAFHLVGISFGGMIAQYTAAKFPDRIKSLALLSTSPKFGLDGTDPHEWREERLAPLLAGQEPKDFASAVLSRLAGPHISETAMAQQVRAMSRISAAALIRSIDCLVTHDSFSALAKIRARSICIVGSLDDETPLAYSQQIAANVVGAQVKVIANAGHLVNAEFPDAVNEILANHFSTEATA